MTDACRCQFCNDPLDLPQTFRFLVEAQAAAEPAFWASIRQLPAAGGRPLRVCKGCQSKVEEYPGRFKAALHHARVRRARAGFLMACGLVSVGLFVGAVLGAPRV